MGFVCFLVIFTTTIIKLLLFLSRKSSFLLSKSILTWFCNMHSNVIFDSRKKDHIARLGKGGLDRFCPFRIIYSSIDVVLSKWHTWDVKLIVKSDIWQESPWHKLCWSSYVDVTTFANETVANSCLSLSQKVRALQP